MKTMKRNVLLCLTVLVIICCTAGCQIGLGGAILTYTVSFKANGGKGTMNAQVFTAGNEQTLNANKFTKNGYTFSGWAKESDASGVEYSDKQSMTVSQDTTLYAIWAKKTTN